MVQKPLTDKEIFWMSLQGKLTELHDLHKIAITNDADEPQPLGVYYNGEKLYDNYVRWQTQELRDIGYYFFNNTPYMELFHFTGTVSVMYYYCDKDDRYTNTVMQYG